MIVQKAIIDYGYSNPLEVFCDDTQMIIKGPTGSLELGFDELQEITHLAKMLDWEWFRDLP